MFELDDKLWELIQWVRNTYGISQAEAIKSIEHKLEHLKL